MYDLQSYLASKPMTQCYLAGAETMSVVKEGYVKRFSSKSQVLKFFYVKLERKKYIFLFHCLKFLLACIERKVFIQSVSFSIFPLTSLKPCSEVSLDIS